MYNNKGVDLCNAMLVTPLKKIINFVTKFCIFFNSLFGSKCTKFYLDSF